MNPEKSSPQPGSAPVGERRKKRHSSSRSPFKVLIILAVLGVFSVVALRFLYPLFKAMKGRNQAAEAERLLETGKVSEALNSIRLATRMAPNEPSVIRVRARYFGRFNSPDTLREWQTLQSIGAATTEDKIDLLEAAVNQHRLDVSAPLLTELSSMQSTNLRVLRLGIRHLTDGGFTDRAIGLARFAFSKDPLHLENQFLLGGLLLSSTNDITAEEGRELVTEIARQKNSLQAMATDLLIRSGRLRTNHVPELLALLDLDSNNITNIVSSLELRWIGQPERRGEIVEAAQRRIAAESDPNRQPPVCEWLLHRAPLALIAVLTEEKAGGNTLLATSRAEALAAVKDWDALELYLKKADDNLKGYPGLLLRARVAMAKERQSEAENLFMGAIEVAAKSPEALMYAARSAESAGLPDTAIRIWGRVAEFPSMTLGSAGELLRLSRNRDQVAAELAVLTRLSSNIPGDVRLGAERAEREALVGVNLKAAAASLEQLLKDDKKERRFVTALALVRLRQGDASAAQSAFEQGEWGWDLLSLRDRAVYVAILGANQQREAARRFALQIDLSQLKSEEKELVTPWL